MVVWLAQQRDGKFQAELQSFAVMRHDGSLPATTPRISSRVLISLSLSIYIYISCILVSKPKVMVGAPHLQKYYVFTEFTDVVPHRGLSPEFRTSPFSQWYPTSTEMGKFAIIYQNLHAWNIELGSVGDEYIWVYVYKYIYIYRIYIYLY